MAAPKKPDYRLDFGEDPAQWRLGRKKAEINRAAWQKRQAAAKKKDKP